MLGGIYWPCLYKELAPLASDLQRSVSYAFFVKKEPLSIIRFSIVILVDLLMPFLYVHFANRKDSAT